MQIKKTDFWVFVYFLFAEMLRSLLMKPGSLFSSSSHCWKNGNIRVFSVSDLHTDHRANWQRLEEWEQSKDKGKGEFVDFLIVAGDISANLSILKKTLELLKSLFDFVIFVPGNNEVRLCFLFP